MMITHLTYSVLLRGYLDAMGDVFALIDCNSFYCSCEILFQPHLRGKPVVVLSNNDGCAIARTPEAKALGIKMGTPEFMIRREPKFKETIMFSSNYTLYGDISKRVQDTVRELIADVEVYSIDEMFLKLPDLPNDELIDLGKQLRALVLKNTGIPTGVGIAPTKTLAKVANNLSKTFKEKYDNVCSLVDDRERNLILDNYPIEELWGIGKASKVKLNNMGIQTVGEMRDMDIKQARKYGTVVAERTILELRGVSCIPLEDLPPARKGTAVTRSFGRRVTSYDELVQAVSTYAARGAEKLRQHELLASKLTVFAHTSKYHDTKQYGAKRSCGLHPLTNDSRQIIEEALRLLKDVYKEGIEFAKAGIYLDELISVSEKPYSMFFEEKQHSDELMGALDKINQKYGRQTLQFASMGLEKKWKLRSNHKSPCYTTRIEDVAQVKAC